MRRLCVHNNLGDLIMSEAEQSISELETRLQNLLSFYEGELRDWENGKILVENEVDFLSKRAKMSKQEEIISDLKTILPTPAPTKKDLPF